MFLAKSRYKARYVLLQSFTNPHTQKHLQIQTSPFRDPQTSGTPTPASDIHNYSSRFVTNFTIYKHSVSNDNYGTTTFSFAALKTWKKFPQNYL